MTLLLFISSGISGVRNNVGRNVSTGLMCPHLRGWGGSAAASREWSPRSADARDSPSAAVVHPRRGERASAAMRYPVDMRFARLLLT
jgi:hypothetical protein